MDKRQLIKDIFSFNFTSFKTRFFKLEAVLKRFFLFPFTKKYSDSKLIPVIINNRNRYTYLLQLISWLENAGYLDIHIIDNASSYPPLLNYYTKTKYTVHRLNDNLGYLALWKSGLYKLYYRNFYVYTDPDILPIADCPFDVLDFWLKKLNQYSSIEKIGFALKIDDLPVHYANKQKVIEWENKFWTNQIEPELYDADIDTTFALYRPFTNGNRWVQKAYRTSGKYMAKHLPWYENSAEQTDENIFYMNNVSTGASHWIEKPNE
ncbi:MAG: glycosyltransferase family 2 protein [Bacteroidia bacterium]|nr:glycosyltransferase family 2 protein [Bacteroidia bacterium]